MASSWQRVHGMERPFHPLQIATWVCFPLFLGLFYGVCIPNLGSVALQASLGTVTGVAGIITLAYTMRTVYANPQAKPLLQHRPR